MRSVAGLAGESHACTVLGRSYVPALMLFAGIGVLFAGVWFWNDYNYWSCVKPSSSS